MKIFASRKETVVTTVIAAFFILVALGFTFEPLITIILRSRTLPAGTTVLMTFNKCVAAPDAINETINLIKSLGFQEPNSAIIAKIGALASNTPLKGYIALAQSETGLPYSLDIETNTKALNIVAGIRQLVARLSPSELITILPDKTTMTEIVIDPGLIPITQQKVGQYDQWSFSTLNPHISIQQKPSSSAILINNPQVVDMLGFEAPLSCRLSNMQTRIVIFDSHRSSLVPTIFRSILAYFRDYSCFQNFSTFSR